MIEKEGQSRQKLTPTAAVYRPPAARRADSRQGSDTRPSDAKRNRVRRPDQQMYVPRPKRTSYGNEQPRSRSRSSSRTSLDSDSCDKKHNSSQFKIEESRLPVPNATINDLSSETRKTQSTATLCNNLETICKKDDTLPKHSLKTGVNSLTTKDSTANDNSAELNMLDHSIDTDLTPTCPGASFSSPIDGSTGHLPEPISKEEEDTKITEQPTRPLGSTCAPSERVDCEESSKMQIELPKEDMNIVCDKNCTTNQTTVATSSIEPVETSEIEVNMSENSSDLLPNEDDSSDSKEMVETRKSDPKVQVSSSKTEAMETISISSDSRADQSSNSSSSTVTSNSDSQSNSESSSDSEPVRRPCRRKSYEKMEIENSINSEKKKASSSDRSSSHDQNLKNRRIFPIVPVSDVLIISDTSSSDSSDKSKEPESKVEVGKKDPKKPSATKETVKSLKKVSQVDPDECDWESLYDDSGECLAPTLLEELANSVGRVRVSSVDSDYRPYQSIEERTNDGECVIEIYDFPAEFKTTDLFNIFAAYRNKNFQIKWVDDTHALGVFPSPLMADEVLACTLPFVKTRPLRLGTVESRTKARNLVLPPLPSIERPKTCTALARRLVSGALGLRLPTSSQEREKEKQVLKEAREKRRLEAKQREAAWDGTLTSGSCI